MKIRTVLLSICILLVFSFSQAVAKPKPKSPGGQLNIEEVHVTIGVADTTLEIGGVNFDLGDPVKVTLAGVPAAVMSSTSDLPPRYRTPS